MWSWRGSPTRVSALWIWSPPCPTPRSRTSTPPLMSPLVWDLGPHRGLRGPVARAPLRRPRRCCARTWPRSTTRSRRRASARGDLPLLRPREARSSTSTRCASARSRSSPSAASATGRSSSWSSATSTSTARRCCRRCSSRAWRAPRPPRRPTRAAPRRPHRPRAVEVPAGAACTIGAAAERLRLRQRAPAPRGRAARLPHRPHAGHQRHLAALRRGRRLRAPRVVVRRGLVVEGAVRHHPPWLHWPDDGRRVAHGRMGAARPGQARRPRLLVRGRRLRPRTRRPPPHRGRVGEGGDLGPGRRQARRYPWGDEPPAARHANLDQRAFGTAAGRRATRTGASPVRRAGHARRRLGVDGERLPRLPRLPRRTPTASTPRSSSAPTTRCCAAARGRPRARVATPTFRNWDLPAAAPDLLRRAAGVGRVSMETDPRQRPDPDRLVPRPRATSARSPTTCSTGSPAVQGAAAEALLRRARLGAVRPDLRAARVLPDAHRAGDPRDRTRPTIVAATGAGGAGRARLRLRRRRRACCSTRWPTRARCARYVPVRRRRVGRARDRRGRWSTSTRASRVHGVVGDFERHLDRVPPPTTAPAHRRASSAARSATSRPAAAAASCAASRRCSAPDDRLLLGTDLVKDPDDHPPPPTTTRQASPPSSTATSCTWSTASWAPTSTPTASSTSRSSTPSASGSRCACARCARPR